MDLDRILLMSIIYIDERYIFNKHIYCVFSKDIFIIDYI